MMATKSPSSATDPRDTPTRQLEGQRRRRPVGLPANSESRAKAKASGLTVGTPAEVSAWADVIMVLVPDTVASEVYKKDSHPT